MKLLLIITEYGSFNNFLSDLSVDMVSKGHEIHVICSRDMIIKRDDKYPYLDIGIKFHFITFPRGFNILDHYKGSKKIHEIIENIKPNLINVHFSTAAFTTLFLKKSKIITLGTFHGLGYTITENIKRRLLFYVVERFCFFRLDQIWLLNNFDLDIVNKIYPNKTFKFKSLGLGCDPEVFSKERFSKQDDNYLKNKLGFKNDEFVLTYTGRFVDFKGYSLVIKTFDLICKNHKDLKLKLILIGGHDPLHSSGLTEDEELNLLKNPNIILIGFTNDVAKYLSITNIFVFPSIKEGMPVCILEALSMGVPVITSGARGCVDLVKHKVTGFVLSPKPCINELYEAIIELFNQPELIINLKNNILLERDNYDKRHYILEQQEIYKEVIDKITF